MTNLTELASRVEAAAGPDNALERDIRKALGIYHLVSAAKSHFTASLDAAMSLVPEGWHGQIQFGNRPGAWVGREGSDAPDFNVAATPALALTAAALRALAAQQETSRG